MSKDTHGRTHRPAGLPKGVAGTYDRNPGTNGDDIAPPMPVHDDPDILRRELASIPQRDGPEYDGLRTRLARAELRQMESKEKHATAADMFRSLSETGGGTWSPRNDATPVVGFCHSPYPERSRVVAMPSTTDDFARLSNGISHGQSRSAVERRQLSGIIAQPGRRQIICRRLRLRHGRA